MTGVRVAGVDCGTNSLRLLVAEIRDGGLHPLVTEMRIVRLGEGVDATGEFAPAALERVRVVLAEYAETMRAHQVRAVRMVATSATRDAGNREAFFAMTDELLGGVVFGARAEVITGDEEAALTFAGAVVGLDPTDGPFIVTDLGGGSTEVVVGELREGRPAVLGGRSVDVGCVRLTERVLHTVPPTGAEVAEARTVIGEQLALTADVPVERARTWVGVAGTFTTLAALAMELPEYDADRIHGAVVGLDRLREVCDRLVGMTTAERLALGPMHEGRADVIGGGALVAQALAGTIAERAGLDRLVVSENDILYGLAMSAAASVG